MSAHIPDSKAKLRQQIRAKLQGVRLEECAAASSRACMRLAKRSEWKTAGSVLFYAPLPQELNVWPLLQIALAVGKTVALPRFDRRTRQYVTCSIQNLAREIVSGRFGIREPAESCAVVPLNRLDLILVPGVAFDLHGRRLGRGRGFYDRLLAHVRGTTCGVAFDEQIVAQIPVEPHDIRLQCILTPTRWIEP